MESVGDEIDSIWLILAIVFIVLFIISFFVNIYLWIIRRRNLIELQEELQQQYIKQLRESQTNVFYGGTKSTFM